MSGEGWGRHLSCNCLKEAAAADDDDGDDDDGDDDDNNDDVYQLLCHLCIIQSKLIISLDFT